MRLPRIRIVALALAMTLVTAINVSASGPAGVYAVIEKVVFELLLQDRPAESGSVSGRLLASANTPAANVRVALTPANDVGTLVALTQTDGEGRYRMENVPAGTYYVIAGAVSSPTYFPDATSPDKARSVSVSPTIPSVVPDFRLLPLSRLYPVSGNLRFAGRIIREGIPTGSTPPRLTVRLTLLRLTGEHGVTDRRLVFSGEVPADGSFDIPNLPSGRYSVSFIPDDNAPNQPLVLEKDIADWKFAIPAQVAPKKR